MHFWKLPALAIVWMAFAVTAKSADWAALLNSAQSGDLRSQRAVAYAFARGEVVPRNLPEAIKWFKSAARQGDASACFDLGMIHRFETVAVDYGVLELLYADAAKGGDSLAQYKTGRAVRHNVQSRGTIRSAQEKSLAWLNMAAAQDQPDAQVELGRLYSQGGMMIEKDPVLAAKWFQKAADKSAEASFLLGKAYFNGDGVLKSASTAVKHFRRAAEAGHAMAQLELSLLLAEGIGVTANPLEAEKWGRLADAFRAPGPYFTTDEFFSLSWMPEGVDLVESHAWFNIASSRGFKAHSIGVEISPQGAMSVLEREMSEKQLSKAEARAEALLAEVSKSSEK
jgi:uncharacterized protein